MPETSSDCRNLPVLKEIVVAENDGDNGFKPEAKLTRLCECAVKMCRYVA